MSNRKANKKKTSPLLDFDRIKAGMEEKDKFFTDIRGHLEAIRSVDMTMIVEAGNLISPPLQEEELLQILACKLSVRVLCLFNCN